VAEATLLDPIGPEGDRRRKTQIEAGLDALKLRPQLQESRHAMAHPSDGLSVVGFWEILVSATGGWTEVWKARFETISHPGVTVSVPWVTHVGTTAQIRVRLTGPGVPAGTVTSSVRNFPANSSTIEDNDWLHGQPLWGGFLTVSLDCQVVGGSTLGLFIPIVAQVDPQECSAGGGHWVGGGS
jgi:hypothetical protein